MIYFDYASTTPLNQEVLSAYTKLLQQVYANADSLHASGREAQRLMEKAVHKLHSFCLLRQMKFVHILC